MDNILQPNFVTRYLHKPQIQARGDKHALATRPAWKQHRCRRKGWHLISKGLRIQLDETPPAKVGALGTSLVTTIPINGNPSNIYKSTSLS